MIKTRKKKVRFNEVGLEHEVEATVSNDRRKTEHQSERPLAESKEKRTFDVRKVYESEDEK